MDGNLTNDGRWVYTWDAENRLIQMETISAATTAGHPYTKLVFKYDWRGHRIERAVWKGGSSGSPTFSSRRRWIYDGWNPIVEFDSNAAGSTNTRYKTYTWGLDLTNTLQGAGGVGGLIVQTDVSGMVKRRASYDGNGNIVAWTRGDQSAPDYRREYDGFGNTLISEGVSPSDYGFSTKQQDVETGLYYYGYRYYDAITGRWPSRDPIEEEGGVNLYSIFGNNLSNSIDFLGLDMITLNISFVEAGENEKGIDTFNLSNLAGYYSFLKESYNTASVPFPDFNDNSKDKSAAYWELLQKAIEEVLDEDDCIKEINITGHGNQQEIGGMHATQMKSDSPQKKFFEWIKSKKCKECGPIVIKACYAAQDALGKDQIQDLADASGFPVVAHDDQYAGVGWGNEWTAQPNGGTPTMTKPGMPIPIQENKKKK